MSQSDLLYDLIRDVKSSLDFFIQLNGTIRQERQTVLQGANKAKLLAEAASRIQNSQGRRMSIRAFNFPQKNQSSSSIQNSGFFSSSAVSGFVSIVFLPFLLPKPSGGRLGEADISGELFIVM
ncbi:hypothetical protein O9G_005262 [Rozella allomycis CSF55]|uniref:Uncharacterized protein n=1 Tax=Rozella allomycis (strain CSF55) TaxID=988480 RepID=A0A075AZ77_ROZAC|nr:hypothetical protein O9G_005262 [Rozella allomycis CSF55]|eukprot:EPZ34017.1 hypothetical protein O9G_005262 [Rozella allomycis CSF55]